jgi:hypothetical protein
MTHVFRVTRKENKGIPPVLHPTLAALYIVLHSKGDLSDIGRTTCALRITTTSNLRLNFPMISWIYCLHVRIAGGRYLVSYSG